jgi:hypothetical protein
MGLGVSFRTVYTAYNETPTKGITMQHTYSLYGSPLHLILEEKVADGHNRVHLGFMEAQKKFKEEYGIQWTPELPIQINASHEDLKAYDDIAKLLNFLIEINGGSLDISEDQCVTSTLDRI